MSQYDYVCVHTSTFTYGSVSAYVWTRERKRVGNYDRCEISRMFLSECPKEKRFLTSMFLWFSTLL